MIRFGVVGTGVIVQEFISAARLHDELSFEAVYSRREETGNDFAARCDLKKVYTDYALMLADNDLDAIYIASPNSLHYPQAKQALLAGKHVMLEKPFTATEDGAKDIIKIAQDKGLILMEAICNVHMPHLEKLKTMMDKLGTLKLVQCNFSQYSRKYDALMAGELPNVFNPEFAGGCLADINIYNLHFVMALFGEPKAVQYQANVHQNGIDLSGVLMLQYPDFIAVCVGAKDSYSLNFGQIQGDKGYVFIKDGVNNMSSLSFTTAEGQTLIEEQDKPRLYYETEVFVEMVNKRDFELRDRYLAHSQAVVRTAEKARKQIGLEFSE